MPISRDTRRRWLGVICLTIAAIMLILGQTVLKSHLRRLAFIYYWLICTVLTGFTLLIALLDMRAVRRRSRQEERNLIQDVFRDITERKNENGDSSKPE